MFENRNNTIFIVDMSIYIVRIQREEIVDVHFMLPIDFYRVQERIRLNDKYKKYAYDSTLEPVSYM